MPGANIIDYDSLAVSSTAKTLEQGTVGIPNRARGLQITVESKAVRLRMDGTAATTDIGGGDLLGVDDVFVLDSWTIPKKNWRSVMLNMSFIAHAGDGSTGNLSIHYFD